MICVLNWGIGHASRVVPIIHMLLKYGQTVYIASDGDALALLRREFPDLEYCELPPYNPIYQKGTGGMMRKILFQMPKFARAIRQEHIMIERLVKEKRIDIVISDNRYGCYSNRVRSILITHQINIQMPKMYNFLEPFVNYYNWQKIKKFYRVWVPDYKDERNLTGELSTSTTVGKRFIGQLSRMHLLPDIETQYDIMVLISGPEPQRTIFEDILRSQLYNFHGTSLLVRGRPTGTNEIRTIGKYSEVDFLDTEQLNLAIQQSALIVCRSGYSTIMDLAKLGKQAILVPTPGQTEQIYLAKQLHKRGVCFYKDQQDFKLSKAIPKTKLYSGFKAIKYENEILKEVLLKVLR